MGARMLCKFIRGDLKKKLSIFGVLGTLFPVRVIFQEEWRMVRGFFGKIIRGDFENNSRYLDFLKLYFLFG